MESYLQCLQCLHPAVTAKWPAVELLSFQSVRKLQRQDTINKDYCFFNIASHTDQTLLQVVTFTVLQVFRSLTYIYVNFYS